MFSPTNISGGDLGPGRLPFNYCDFYQNTYNTSGGVCWFLHTDEAEFYVKVIFVGLVVIFGILGNLLLGATVLLSSRLRCRAVNEPSRISRCPEKGKGLGPSPRTRRILAIFQLRIY